MKTRLNLSALILMGLALSISFGVFFRVREWTRERKQAEFTRDVEEGANLLQAKLEQHLTLLYSIQGFYASSKEVERDEFRLFVEQALVRHPELVSLQWVARVPAAGREAFEEAVRQEGYPNFQITQWDSGGSRVRAENRGEYFPICYSEPSERAQGVLGFDLGEETVRSQALELARDAGEAVATPWIRLLISDSSDPKGFLLFLPVYRNGAPHETLQQRRENLAGFALAVYRIGDMLEAALQDWEKGKIELFLQEEGRSEEEKVLTYGYGPAGTVSWRKENLVEGDRGGARGIAWKGKLHVGGQEWILTARPTAQYFSAQYETLPGLVLAVGILTSFLIFGTVHNIAGYTSAIEKQVAARTRELSIEASERKRLMEQLARSNEEIRQKAQEVAQRNLELKQQRIVVGQKADTLAQNNEELKKQERVMHSLLEDLTLSKERVEQKTREAEAANRKLQEMAALKDEFVAKVSHELRTPLTSVKEGLNLMLDGALGQTTADQQDFLRTMDGDLDRLAELINNMLDLSKIESGRMQLVRHRVEITELIRSTVRSYQSIAAGREVVERFQPAPEVFVDANRILQVLGNLFSNAVKYGREGGKITFGVEPQNGSVRVWVEDEGEGIAPEEIPKLFQKFSQVGRMDQSRPKGTGLGLVVCKELVELHGGRIEVESKTGQGTRFILHLPAYSDTLALNENFRELKEHAAAEQTGVGLIALRAEDSTGGGSLGRQELDRIAEEVRQRLHHADIVFGMEPCWVVILAATDSRGVQAIVRRLGQSLPGVERFRFGASLYPADGKEAAALFEEAKKTLGQGLPARPSPVVRP